MRKQSVIIQAIQATVSEGQTNLIDIQYSHIDPIHKWQLFSFCSVIVQISLPSLTLEQEFFSIYHIKKRLGKLICTRTKE